MTKRELQLQQVPHIKTILTGLCEMAEESADAVEEDGYLTSAAAWRVFAKTLSETFWKLDTDLKQEAVSP